MAVSSVADWDRLLRGYSNDFLKSEYMRDMDKDGTEYEYLDEGRWNNHWVGREPAIEDAMIATEKRLGIDLPLSYRNFLLVSNGWSAVVNSAELSGVENIGWFSELEPDLLEAWSDVDHFAESLEILRRSLLISNDDGGTGHYLLLHAGTEPDSEWVAYEWWPGDGEDLQPYEDFASLMAGLWEHEEEARRTWGVDGLQSQS